MVEFYEQEGILVASEGLSLYLHEARDSFYDPIRNERVATLIARDVQIREQIMKTKIDTALGIFQDWQHWFWIVTATYLIFKNVKYVEEWFF